MGFFVHACFSSWGAPIFTFLKFNECYNFSFSLILWTWLIGWSGRKIVRSRNPESRSTRWFLPIYLSFDWQSYPICVLVGVTDSRWSSRASPNTTLIKKNIDHFVDYIRFNISRFTFSWSLLVKVFWFLHKSVILNPIFI